MSAHLITSFPLKIFFYYILLSPNNFEIQVTFFLNCFRYLLSKLLCPHLFHPLQMVFAQLPHLCITPHIEPSCPDTHLPFTVRLAAPPYHAYQELCYNTFKGLCRVLMSVWGTRHALRCYSLGVAHCYLPAAVHFCPWMEISRLCGSNNALCVW